MLTEPTFFDGSLEHLSAVRAAVKKQFGDRADAQLVKKLAEEALKS